MEHFIRILVYSKMITPEKSSWQTQGETAPAPHGPLQKPHLDGSLGTLPSPAPGPEREAGSTRAVPSRTLVVLVGPMSGSMSNFRCIIGGFHYTSPSERFANIITKQPKYVYCLTIES